MVAIVLLPGMDGSGDLFADFCAALGEEVRPVVVSYPKNLPLDYRGLEAFARDRLPVNEPFFLLGESFSGPIAISLAASKPTGLIGLVLCCTFARNPHPLLSYFKRMTGVLPVAASLSGLMAPLLFGSFSSLSLRTRLQQTLSDISADTLRARLRAVLEVDYSGKMKEIEIPVLYLQAADDRIVPSSAGRYIQTAVPSTTIVRLHSPHLLLQAIPFEAATVVKKYCAEAVMSFDVSQIKRN